MRGSEAFAKTPLHPRLFKSHETAAAVARGGKYVCVVREPLDVFFSFYEFLPAYMGLERGAVSMEAFCDAIFAGASHSGDVWSHFLGWLDRREETEAKTTEPTTEKTRAERVLVVSFEEMKRDLRAVARRVGTFLKTHPEDDELSEADLDFVTRMSDFERMRADATKRTFAFEVSCISDALRGIEVTAPSESPPPAQTPPPIEAVFLGGDQPLRSDACGTRLGLRPAAAKIHQDMSVQAP